jgi:hypothetical protein
MFYMRTTLGVFKKETKDEKHYCAYGVTDWISAFFI